MEYMYIVGSVGSFLGTDRPDTPSCHEQPGRQPDTHGLQQDESPAQLGTLRCDALQEIGTGIDQISATSFAAADIALQKAGGGGGVCGGGFGIAFKLQQWQQQRQEQQPWQ